MTSVCRSDASLPVRRWTTHLLHWPILWITRTATTSRPVYRWWRCAVATTPRPRHHLLWPPSPSTTRYLASASPPTNTTQPPLIIWFVCFWSFMFFFRFLKFYQYFDILRRPYFCSVYWSHCKVFCSKFLRVKQLVSIGKKYVSHEKMCDIAIMRPFKVRYIKITNFFYLTPKITDYNFWVAVDTLF